MLDVNSRSLKSFPFFSLLCGITPNEAECWQIMSSFGMEIRDQHFIPFTAPKLSFV